MHNLVRIIGQSDGCLFVANGKFGAPFRANIKFNI